jgi:glycosyltransferase involved in cell wall biosynthesis
VVTISCSGKFHAFALAEQMERLGQLNRLYTTYAYQKNKLLAKIVKRVDKENIPAAKISTNNLLAFPIKLAPRSVYLWNDLFDQWVASNITGNSGRVFIGWSGMSLHSVAKAKAKKMTTILERGSSHIVYQNKLLQDEYKNFGIEFSVDPRVIDKELAEYDLADFISVPSHFVRNSFMEMGVHRDKLIMNPYGAGKAFTDDAVLPNKKNEKFTIVYLGTLSIRKGLVYLFKALAELDIPINDFDVWFIGKIEPELATTVEKYKKSNWTFFGQVDHYQLKSYLSKCHVGVQPSVEEGLSMVIPQMMACGVVMIVTPNSGGENIINNGVNGFVVPIRSHKSISGKIEFLYKMPEELDSVGLEAKKSIKSGFLWNDYGNRYLGFLNNLLGSKQSNSGK